MAWHLHVLSAQISRWTGGAPHVSRGLGADGGTPMSWTTVPRHVSPDAAGGGENPAPGDCLRLPHCRPAPRRQARAGAAEPVRPRRAADDFQHRPERDHRRRQQHHRRPDWRRRRCSSSTTVVVRFLYSHERLERLVEGAARHAHRARAARRGGAQTGADHEPGDRGWRRTARASTRSPKWTGPCSSPGGAINFTRKTPTPGEERHQEIMRELRRIDALLTQVTRAWIENVQDWQD